MFRNLVAACVGLAIMGVAGSAKAGLFELTFTAENFAAVGGPQDVVSGSFTYEAASATTPIINLVSVSLEIDGQVYTPDNVGFIQAFKYTIGGTIGGGGPNVISQLGPDFMLLWTLSSGVPHSFSYSTPTGGAVFTASAFTDAFFSEFSITEIEPETAPDHYNAYQVGPKAVTGGTGKKLNELNIDVTLVDQFGESLLTVGKANLLLVPVDKAGEGIVDDVTHLVCYNLGDPAGGKGKGTGVAPKVDVAIVNQFNEDVGVQVMEVTKLKMLCVPSTKELLE